MVSFLKMEFLISRLPGPTLDAIPFFEAPPVLKEPPFVPTSKNWKFMAGSPVSFPSKLNLPATWNLFGEVGVISTSTLLQLTSIFPATFTCPVVAYKYPS